MDILPPASRESERPFREGGGAPASGEGLGMGALGWS